MNDYLKEGTLEMALFDSVNLSGCVNSYNKYFKTKSRESFKPNTAKEHSSQGLV